nr:MAG TPA: hypothetical protein [Crassvirales sp.]
MDLERDNINFQYFFTDLNFLGTYCVLLILEVLLTLQDL